MSSKRKGQGVLCGIAVLVAAIWLGVLPQIAEIESVQRRVQKFRDAGIETGAVFYSDHPSMRDIERRVDSVVNGADRAFWHLPTEM
ncbi:hypothetical protein VN12_17955 [Pirellula sp. SH-Sr6A]|uniref:hypothetical protein n=1 Tax=Pirellula sp. SH-Sr6A TaxID=1632865 RepID=UPI00078DE850|nr:hypothetical protein [Pirellula sp. SH-Sr6A]AMV34019.1 hypothetical protein VN12_17955 [Pirellula sp. SH-Sr6A]